MCIYIYIYIFIIHECRQRGISAERRGGPLAAAAIYWLKYMNFNKQFNNRHDDLMVDNLVIISERYNDYVYAFRLLWCSSVAGLPRRAHRRRGAARGLSSTTIITTAVTIINQLLIIDYLLSTTMIDSIITTATTTINIIMVVTDITGGPTAGAAGAPWCRPAGPREAHHHKHTSIR